MNRFVMIKSALVTLSLLFVAACSGSSCSSPENQAERVLQQHVIAETFYDEQAFAETLVAADREIFEAMDKEDELFELSYMMDALESALGRLIKVEVTSFEIDDDTMEVTTTITLPNEEEIDELFIDAFDDIDPPEDADKDELGKLLGDATADALKGAEISTIEEEHNFTLKLEDGKWLVYLNLATHQAITDGAEEVEDLARNGNYAEAYDKLDDLREEFGDVDDEDLLQKLDEVYVYTMYQQIMSWAFETDKDEEKLAYYQKIVDIDPDWDFPPITTEEAKKEIAEIEERFAEKEALKAYRENITISDVEVETRFMNIIKGEIKNEGDRTLDSINLAYSLLDDEGNEVRSNSHNVLMAFGDEDRAMKPGHESSFSIYVTDAPSSWSEEVELRVGEIQFFE